MRRRRTRSFFLIFIVGFVFFAVRTIPIGSISIVPAQTLLPES